MIPRLPVAAILWTAWLVIVAASPVSPPAPTVVLLVRHAEKAPGAGDVPLSEAGRSRAEALTAIGKEAGVAAIITTQFRRTRETAQGLAADLGIAPQVVEARADIAAHAAEVAAAVRRQSGHVVLVVGHSNTIPSIVAALGGPRFPDLCDGEYDALFVVVLETEGAVHTIRSRFGAATPVAADCAAMK